MKQCTYGFILPLAMMIIFAISALILQLMTRSTAMLPLRQVVLEREQAQQLALMGVRIVQAQLTACIKEEQEKQAWYTHLLTSLNQWQTFVLKEKVDGIDGSIKVYMSSEEGKIPLNALWDFKNKKFTENSTLNAKALLKDLVITQEGGEQKANAHASKQSSMLEALERSFKRIAGPFEDVTQLLSEPTFTGLKPSSPEDTLFAQPYSANKQGGASIILGDLFTIYRSDSMIQPLLFSSSIKTIFGLQTISDEKKQEDALKNLIDKLKDSIDWKNQWNELLAPLYGKTYDTITPEFKKMFNSAVSASSLKSIISVVSYGNIGDTTQKVLAFLAPELDSNKCVTYSIRRLYWL